MTALMFIYLCKYIYGCWYKSKVLTKMIFVPERARKLRDLVRSISSPNESSDEEFTHDLLMDEDVEFRVTCDYVEEQNYPDSAYY